MAAEAMNELAQTFQNQIQKVFNANSSISLDFGTIQDDYSLLTDKYPIAIPKADYHVLRQLTLGATDSVLTTTSEAEDHKHTGDGSHTHDGGSHDGHSEGYDGNHTHSGGSHSHGEAGAHSHDVLIPEKMRWLLPGDRVLVAWVTNNEAVVIDIVYKATAIG